MSEIEHIIVNMKEIVYHETLPYDLTLRLVMGDASRTFALRGNRLLSPQSELNQIKTAAEMLAPEQPEQQKGSHYSRAHREHRLIEHAREALAVPETETEENVRLLLGRASLTLGSLANGETVETSDIMFTEIVIKSMHDLASSRRDRS
jgi:hypothetical protein